MERPVENSADTTDDFSKSPLPVLFRWVAYIFAGTGIVGNLFVIVVTLRHTKLWRQLTCKYIVNQSIIDALTLAVFIVRIQTVPDDHPTVVSLGGLQADVYCRLWSSPFLLYGLLLSSTYNLVAISVERYLGTARPFWHKVSFTHTKVTLSIVAIWLCSIAYMTCVVTVPSYMSGGKCHLANSWPLRGIRIFVASITLFIALGVPLFVHVFWYGT
ncbi:hypothetical protein LSAT2_004812, partial [Lamellibrachia satsuma]